MEVAHQELEWLDFIPEPDFDHVLLLAVARRQIALQHLDARDRPPRVLRPVLHPLELAPPRKEGARGAGRQPPTLTGPRPACSGQCCPVLSSPGGVKRSPMSLYASRAHSRSTRWGSIRSRIRMAAARRTSGAP